MNLYRLLPEVSETHHNRVKISFKKEKITWLENEQTYLALHFYMVMSMHVPFWFPPMCRSEAGGEDHKGLIFWLPSGRFPKRASFLI